MDTKTDAQVVRERDDAEMLKRSHLWPQLRLPLTRNGDAGKETAVLDDPCPPAERWMLREGANLWDRNPLAGRPVFYDSAEAIIEAGWRVD